MGNPPGAEYAADPLQEARLSGYVVAALGADVEFAAAQGSAGAALRCLLGALDARAAHGARDVVVGMDGGGLHHAIQPFHVRNAFKEMPTAKAVFKEMAETGGESSDIIAKCGLEQISDETVLKDLVTGVLDRHPEEVAKYLAGKEKLLKFLVGQLMKETRGKANPRKVTELLKEALAKRRR